MELQQLEGAIAVFSISDRIAALRALNRGLRRDARKISAGWQSGEDVVLAHKGRSAPPRALQAQSVNAALHEVVVVERDRPRAENMRSEEHTSELQSLRHLV